MILLTITNVMLKNFSWLEDNDLAKYTAFDEVKAKCQFKFYIKAHYISQNMNF